MFIPVAWYFLLGNANHPTGFQQPSLSPRWAPPGILCVSFWSRSGMFQQVNFGEFTNRHLIVIFVGPFNDECEDEWVCLCLTSRKSRLKSFSKELQKAMTFLFRKVLVWLWMMVLREVLLHSVFFDKGILGVFNQNPKKLQQAKSHWWQVLSLPACPLRSTQGEEKESASLFGVLLHNALFAVEGIFILVHFSGLPFHHDVLCGGKW